MKRSLLIIAVFVISTSSLKAQIQKGDWLLGATMGYSNGNNSQQYSNMTHSSSSSNTNVSPRIGLAIGKNSVIGLKAGFSTGNYNSDNYSSSSTNFSCNLFWRKYTSIKNKLGWYSEFGGGILWGKTKSSSPSINKQKITSYSIGFTPGLYYEITPKILLNADFGGISFVHSHAKNVNGNPSSGRANNFDLSFLNHFTFGVDFILGKK